MDPIHPIAPLPPSLPPVAPAPMVGRIDRDGNHSDARENKRRRRPPSPAVRDVEERDADGDSGLHINVTA